MDLQECSFSPYEAKQPAKKIDQFKNKVPILIENGLYATTLPQELSCQSEDQNEMTHQMHLD